MTEPAKDPPNRVDKMRSNTEKLNRATRARPLRRIAKKVPKSRQNKS